MTGTIVNTSKISTSCSNLLCTIVSVIHFCSDKFPAVLLHTSNQYVKQSFYTITVLLEDGPVRSETCMA